MLRLSVRVSVLALLLLLVACGWQLRGTVALSNNIDSLYLTSDDDYGPFMVELRNRLQANDVALADGPLGAQYALLITDQRQERRVAALGSDALASAYELTLTVRFDVLDHTGMIIARNLSGRVTRSYNATGSSGAQEEELILREMRAELAQQALRQLQAVINAHRAEGEPAQPELDNPIPTRLPPSPADSATHGPEAPHGEASP